jgi:ABC-type transport system involved in cytochrome c biogenesis permease subunit
MKNWLPLLFYAAAAIAYAIHFSRRNAGVGKAATTLLLAGAFVHTFAVGMQTMEVRHVPFANPSRAISTFVWLLALAYLYTELTTDERAMGVFILPIIVALQVVPVLDPGFERIDPMLDSAWFWIHVASLLFAYASFALAGMLGLTYVLQFKEIKKKHLGFFYTRLPSLQVLDVMNSRAVTVGWICMTLGVIVGIIWATQVRAAMPGNPRVEMFSPADPKIFVAILTWVVYSFAVIARRAMGWQGRRAAVLSAVGFAIVLLNFLPMNYFVTTSHTFN